MGRRNKSLNSLKKLITIATCLGALLLIEDTKAESRNKIGVIIPLSGPVSEVGESIRNGIEFSKNDFDPKDEVKLIFEDDQFQAKNTVNAMWKLIEIDKVDAVITFGGSTSSAVADIAERKSVPMIAVTALSSIGKNK